MEVRLSKKQRADVNLGKFPNYVDPGLLRMFVLVPYDFLCELAEFATAEEVIEEFKVNLRETLTADDFPGRSQPIGPFESMDDKTTEAGKATLGYGREIFTSKEIIGWMFKYLEGGLDYHNKVMKYDGLVRQYKAIGFDEKGNVYAAKATDQDGIFLGIKGLELSVLKPHPWKAPNQNSAPEYGITLQLKKREEWDNELYVIATGEDMLGFVEQYNVQDVILTQTAEFAAQTAQIMAILGGVNLLTEVPAFVDPDAFLAKNEDTGNPITIDSVTKDSEGRGVVVLDETDPDYVVGQWATLELNLVNTLAADPLDLKYYASNKVRFRLD